MTFRVHIKIGNEAMSEPEQIAAALVRVARLMEAGGELVEGWAPITDGNGKVGRFEVIG